MGEDPPIFADVATRRSFRQLDRHRPEPSRVQGHDETDSEDQILGILVAPLRAGETSFLGYQRKEWELVQLFLTLSRAVSRALRTRLSRGHAADPLASAFRRLVIERQERLLAVLSAAPRRAAIAVARRIP